jgi:hypothetical protein
MSTPGRLVGKGKISLKNIEILNCYCQLATATLQAQNRGSVQRVELEGETGNPPAGWESAGQISGFQVSGKKN